jgi:hypothetical protein
VPNVRRWVTPLVATLAVAAAGPVASSVAADAPASPIAVAAKTCSAGYTHAVISGAQKCLRRGEFCAAAARSQYPRYGYRCVAGRLR